jgi:hypothetical protein
VPLLLQLPLRNNSVWLKGTGSKSYAKVLKPDIELNGSVVHVIDRVLLPTGYDVYEAVYTQLKNTSIAQAFFNATEAADKLPADSTVFAPGNLVSGRLLLRCRVTATMH